MQLKMRLAMMEVRLIICLAFVFLLKKSGEYNINSISTMFSKTFNNSQAKNGHVQAFSRSNIY